MADIVTPAMLTKLSDLALVYLANKGLDATQKVFFSNLFQDRKIRKAFATAISEALEEFNIQYPSFRHILFHQDDFFKPYFLPQLEKLLERELAPDVAELEKFHQEVFGSEFQNVKPAMKSLVHCVESALNNYRELAPLLDSAQIREIHDDMRHILPDVENISRGIGQLLTEKQTLDETTPLSKKLDDLTAKQLLHEKSLDLLSWPQTLSSGEWIERPELEALHNAIEKNQSSSIVLLGGPGCGKSALLSRFGEMLSDEGHFLLAIKADMVPAEIHTQKQLSEWLALPVIVESCIRELAREHKVILLIDQLDALCTLVDIRTERLSVLIDLANKLNTIPNVHTILSCRDFEFNYDIRFKRLDAEEVRLDLPSLETIDALLQKRGIEVFRWPQNFRDMLRTPQHLKIFFDFFSDEKLPEFTTYQSMLEAVWTKQIVRQESGVDLVLLTHDIATSLAENEELWAAISKFEDRINGVESLVANGILTFDAGRKKIGFTHQTLFDFSRAKAFAAGKGKLAEFVLARQDALFIRPALWSSLVYLRSASTSEYYREFDILWNENDLRTHVRLMLMEFLGGLHDPDDQEALWLLPYLEHEKLSGTALAVMQGSVGWFDRIKGSYLPEIMNGDEKTASRVFWFLTPAWKFAKEEILPLIETHWLTRPGKDGFSLDLLSNLDSWDERACEIAARILSRCTIQNGWYINNLISIASASRPELAPTLVKSVFTAQLNAVKNAEEKESKSEGIVPVNSERDDEEHIVEEMIKNFREPFSKLLADENWHDLPEIAKAAPKEFLDAISPWFVEVASCAARVENELIFVYKDDAGLATSTFDQEKNEERYPVIKALVVSIEEVAEKYPDEFFLFLNQWKGSDLLSVHRLLVKGLIKVSISRPDVALEYLLADPRRFVVGDFENCHSYSQQLIAHLAGQLNDNDFMQLERALLGWSYYRFHPPEDGASLKRDRMKYERQHRLRLLLALPTNRLSAGAKRFVEEEKRAFSNIYNHDCRFNGFKEIGSPVSDTQMEKASDEHILQLFETLPDETEWDHPKKTMQGGSIQASRAFGAFAKNSPERALLLIDKFEPGTQERPVAEALQCLAKEELISKDTLIKIVESLCQKGFRSEEFRHSAAAALAQVASEPGGLPDHICSLLKSWLTDADSQSFESGDTGEDIEEKYDSILWSWGRMRVVPQGNLTILEALMRGYLLRRPCEYNVWLALLEQHLDREEDPAVWKCLSEKFHLLSSADKQRAERIIEVVIKNRISGSYESVVCVAKNISWLSPELVQALLDSIKDEDWPKGPQAYGELLILGMSLVPENDWYVQKIEELLTEEVASEIKIAGIKLGLAHGAAHLWKENHEALTPIVCCLFDEADTQIASALMALFRVEGSFALNKYSRAIIDSIIAYPQSLKGSVDSSLIESLIEFLPVEAERVYRLCNAILDQCGKDVANMQTGLSASAGELIDIALTLQRLPSWRERGLELFERLLELDIYGVKGVLFELDRRPVKSQPRMPIRRKRKRKK